MILSHVHVLIPRHGSFANSQQVIIRARHLGSELAAASNIIDLIVSGMFQEDMDKFPDMVLMQKSSPKNLWRVSRSVICLSALTVFHFLTPQALLSQSLVCKVNWIPLSRFRFAILTPLSLTYCASISPSFFHHSCFNNICLYK